MHMIMLTTSNANLINSPVKRPVKTAFTKLFLAAKENKVKRFKVQENVKGSKEPCEL